MLLVYGCIANLHDLRLVVLAGLICLFSCFSAFSLMTRVMTTTGRVRYAWLAAVAVVTGCGVWATHFVAMMAFRPGLPVGYEFDLTILSVFVAMCLSGVGFSVSLNHRYAPVGGAIVGLGVAAMHFIGMAAMSLPAQKNWDLIFVVSSILIGVTFAAFALDLFHRKANLTGRTLGAVLLAVGICGMHFTAMAALSFTPDPLVPIAKDIIPSDWMAIAIVSVAVLIVIAGLVGSVVDQGLANRAALEAEHLRQHVIALETTTNALRESEKRIRGIAENLEGFLFQCIVAPDGAVRFDIVDSNRFALAVRPEAPSEEHPQEPLGFVSEEDRQTLEKIILRAHRLQSGWELTFRVATLDGSHRSVHATARLTQNAQSGSLWDGVALDETDRIAARARYAQLRTRLRHAEKLQALGTLAGGLAHELNNLLQPIMTNSELVMIQLPPQSPHFNPLHQVVDASGKAAEIIQRILAFGPADDSEYAILDFSALVREVSAFVRTILPATIDVRSEIKDSALLIRGDRVALTEVLINLMTNARDAIGVSPGTIWISLSRISTDDAAHLIENGTIRRGTYAVLTIRDSGEGMDSATAKRVFEPFFTTKEVGRGTGLGLSVAHGIITNHDGAITVESAPDRGTVFSIYLPLEQEAVALAATG